MTATLPQDDSAAELSIERAESIDSSEYIEIVERLVSILSQNALTHLEYKNASTHILLKKEQSRSSLDAAQELNIQTEAPQPTLSPETQPTELVKAPLVGLAYRAKEPGAPPFVEVGSEVSEGTVICLIEAMKMFNEVKAPKSGIVKKIHFEDGELVEFGAPLFSIEA